MSNYWPWTHPAPVATVETSDMVVCEEKVNPIKKSTFKDSDGNFITVSYGEYETEEGIEKILGIDTPYETVSILINDVTPIIEALKKVA